MWHLLTLLMALSATSANAMEGLELLNVEETIDSARLVRFTGTVQNTRNQSILLPKIVVSLKKEGKVMGIFIGTISGPTDGYYQLHPGEIGIFDVHTGVTRDQYDEFSVRSDGGLNGLDNGSNDFDRSLLTGDLTLVEDSFNLTADWGENALFFGELLNGTNAILQAINVRISLFDAKDAFIGAATIPRLYLPNELSPGEVLSFQATSDVPLSNVVRWEISIEYAPARLGHGDATAVGDATWGEVKHSQRLR